MLLENRTADYEMENENLSTLVEEKDELLYQLKQKHKTVKKEVISLFVLFSVTFEFLVTEFTIVMGMG